ncbi:MAG: YitT family protein [Streptococcaceae bacterium]|jgi:uncharacterized membrane-anchored protein YitT (DUF2179 family)|nr:YitT family protein [Streptococcaceae bacterium]MCH4176997.1 YitT family protein [Streptococcaceae bacterium]
MINKIIDFFSKSFSFQKFSQKFTAALIYAFMSSVALNLFFQPGHVYSSGITGLAQIFTTLSGRWFGFTIPVSATLYLLNLPLFIIAWRYIGRRFTIYTILTVTMSSLFIHFMPEVTLTSDPIMNAIFGGVVNGAGIGYALRNNISSGGTDIISISVRKQTGHSVGSISLIFNGCIMVVAGLLFGWQYMFYSMLTIFMSSRVTDAIFTKQKKMQVMIVTKNPDLVIKEVQYVLHRGVTIVNEVEGGYSHEKKTILFTIITRYEYAEFKHIMETVDPSAFVSISENVKILGNFYKEPGELS